MMKKILIDISGHRNQRLKSEMIDAIKTGFKLFGNYEFTLRNENIDPRDYDIVLFFYWKLSENKFNELTELKSLKIQTFFMSDGLFQFKNKKKCHSKYPLFILPGGPTTVPSPSYCDRKYNTELPNDRLCLFGDELKLSPWKLDGNKVVIAHQRGISYDLKDKYKFYKKLIIDLKNKGYYTIFRVHPQCSCSRIRKISIEECGANLCDEISHSGRDTFKTDGIYASVSYGGKVSSRYIINGIPSFTKESTVSDPLCGNNIDIDNRITPPREWWIRWLSYRHWTLNEFSKGSVLQFLVNNNEVRL